MPSFKWQALGDLASVFTGSNLGRSAGIALIVLLFAAPGAALLGARLPRFLAGFAVVAALAWTAQLLAGNVTIKNWGFEYVLFALVLGLVINHTVGVPDWLREAVRTEFYIKSGLVILGANVLVQELLGAGLLGIAQAILVVTVVWYVAYWIARKLRVDDELAVMLSTAVSICGVSAAIAACGAIQGDRKKLSYITSLVLIVAAPMMVLMPLAAKAWHLPDAVAGAWLGGTLDTSGSVVAAGQLISDQAMKAGVIVKFSQNVLIGVAAFLLSIWWSMRNTQHPNERPSARVIWDRFPKFVLGFVAASIVFSFAVDPATVKSTKPVLDGLRNFWFALAFVSIGLETHFGELVSMQGGRPALAFTAAQLVNVVWTLLLAWLLFGGIIVAAPVLK
ncbi:MAG: putative sulfate exporter family transporter [Verrucomicrobiales bacterium]|nr:putative sulfate exporter family transporter [Verrucomicrobiales bacterium]